MVQTRWYQLNLKGWNNYIHDNSRILVWVYFFLSKVCLQIYSKSNCILPHRAKGYPRSQYFQILLKEVFTQGNYWSCYQLHWRCYNLHWSCYQIPLEPLSTPSCYWLQVQHKSMTIISLKPSSVNKLQELTIVWKLKVMVDPFLFTQGYLLPAIETSW